MTISVAEHLTLAQHRARLSCLWAHKVHVYRAGRKLGLGRWRLAVHDLGKLRPSTWMAYARYFELGNVEHCQLCDEPKRLRPNAIEGWEWPACTNQDCAAFDQPMAAGNWHPPIDRKRAFDLAWKRHQQARHHWQAWVVIHDNGNVLALPMDDLSCREMVADWAGASAANPYGDLQRWWLHNRNLMLLHPDTRVKVAEHLRTLGVEPSPATRDAWDSWIDAPMEPISLLPDELSA